MKIWISEALAYAGMKQAVLARRLTQQLGKSIDRAAVNKMTKGQRQVYADEMLAISEITGYPVPDKNNFRDPDDLRDVLSSSIMYGIQRGLVTQDQISDVEDNIATKLFNRQVAYLSASSIETFSDLLHLPFAYLIGHRSHISPKDAVGATIELEKKLIAEAETRDWRKPLPKRESVQRPIPVYASVEGGEGALILSNEPIGYEPYPNLIADEDDLYGVVVEGTSMAKAYRPGDTAWIHPKYRERRDEPCVFRRYDHTTGEARATLKWLNDFNSEKWKVEQLNPPKEFELLRSEWPECYRVLGKKNRA